MNLLAVILQIDLKGKLDQILSDYAIPVIIFLIVLSGVFGVLLNLDKIMDSEGRGTRKEGIMNVIYILGGVTLAVAVISAIVAIARTVTL